MRSRPSRSLRLVKLLRLLVFAFGVVGITATTPSAQISVSGNGLRIGVPGASLKRLRDQHVVKQQLDFSCGAAALATLLRYGFNHEVTERQILQDLFNQLSDDEKKTAQGVGFSLLDLQRVARARGYAAEGFRLDRDQLTMLGGPVIVFIEPHGYKHFAVLRGIRGGRVYLSDPSLGNVRMPLYAFLDRWLQDDNKGIIFVVEPKSGVVKGSDFLTLTNVGSVQPEIVAARELMAVRAPLLRPSTR